MYVEATQPVNASEILTRVSFRLLSYLIYTLLVCFGLELFFFFYRVVANIEPNSVSAAVSTKFMLLKNIFSYI